MRTCIEMDDGRRRSKARLRTCRLEHATLRPAVSTFTALTVWQCSFGSTCHYARRMSKACRSRLRQSGQGSIRHPFVGFYYEPALVHWSWYRSKYSHHAQAAQNNLRYPEKRTISWPFACVMESQMSLRVVRHRLVEVSGTVRERVIQCGGGVARMTSGHVPDDEPCRPAMWQLCGLTSIARVKIAINRDCTLH